MRRWVTAGCLVAVVTLVIGACGGATGQVADGGQSASPTPTGASSPAPAPRSLPSDEEIAHALDGMLDDSAHECDRDRSPRQAAGDYVGCLARGTSTELPDHEGSVFVALLTPPDDLTLRDSIPAASWLRAPAPTVGEWLPVCDGWTELTDARLADELPSAERAVSCFEARRWRVHTRVAAVSGQVTVLAAATIRLPPLRDVQVASDHSSELAFRATGQVFAEL